MISSKLTFLTKVIVSSHWKLSKTFRRLKFKGEFFNDQTLDFRRFVYADFIS